jgi:predicted kinase
LTPLLIILTGLPYSGKTTLAQALEQSGAAVVELDHINRERGFRIEDGVPMAEWPETIRQAEARIAESGAEQLPRRTATPFPTRCSSACTADSSHRRSTPRGP